MKFLIDMNLTPRWVDFLRDAAFDAVHWSEIGRPDADDGLIMTHARAQGFVLVTSDLDFSAMLAATGGAMPSVVQIRMGDLSPEGIGQATLAAIRGCEAQLDAGAVLSVDARRARIRTLPINHSP